MLKLTKTGTVARALKLRLGTPDPDVFNEGDIVVRFNVLSKPEMTELIDAGTSDDQYIRRVLVDVSGLVDDDGQPISGEAALAEVLSGRHSTALQRAILDEFFSQFEDVRVKNSRPSRGR